MRFHSLEFARHGLMSCQTWTARWSNYNFTLHEIEMETGALLWFSPHCSLPFTFFSFATRQLKTWMLKFETSRNHRVTISHINFYKIKSIYSHILCITIYLFVLPNIYFRFLFVVRKVSTGKTDKHQNVRPRRYDSC